MNNMLVAMDLSPIPSQTRQNLENCSGSSLRRMASKLNNAVAVFTDKMAQTIAPGQHEKLVKISERSLRSKSTRDSDQIMNDEIVQNLKQLYDVYVKERMPFVEQVRLLSLLPRSWKYEMVTNNFGASQHAIKTAHKMFDGQTYILENGTKPCIRQRADPETIKHFVSWLVESNTLVSGSYGLTVLRMDNGEKQEVPQQILQLQKSHAIFYYKKYCDETDYESLSTSKLYDILNSIKPSQQKAVAGLDEFVVEGVESWRTLSDLLNSDL
ncbi:unnamed protein product [Adineta ricciae]|uniref:Uncharacterized protein n=1 Tax=Adineta ricciae TaxID=249248 RepID=A0A815Q8V3_ADIRI|nr:unnamed protein product [Adineta ricciae]CAF1471967.1 unnamed protein product [Adineta ricciae]